MSQGNQFVYVKDILSRYRTIVIGIVLIDVILIGLSYIPAGLISEIISYYEASSSLYTHGFMLLSLVFTVEMFFSSLRFYYEETSRLKVGRNELEIFLNQLFRRKNYNLGKSYGELNTAQELTTDLSQEVISFVIQVLANLSILIFSLLWLAYFDETLIFINIFICAGLMNIVFSILLAPKMIKRNIYESSIGKKRENTLSALSLGLSFINNLKFSRLLNSKMENVESRVIKETIKTFWLNKKIELVFFIINTTALILGIYKVIFMFSNNEINSAKAFGIFYIFSLGVSKLSQSFEIPVSFINMIQSIKLRNKIIDFSTINDLNTNLSEDSFNEIQDIVFKEFSSKYFGSDLIYKVDYLKLVKGGRYLVSGANGAGKSTILKLISGLNSPLSGKLVVNGERVKEAYQWLKKNVLYLSVHDSLFKGGVEDNVSFFSENPQENYIACEILMALGFYDNIGGENSRFKIKLTPFGDGVSRGQKQKILIARAILKRPRILILDEVSSGMDQVSEEKLIATLKKFLPNTIILYVLHKHSAQQKKFIQLEVDKGKLIHES